MKQPDGHGNATPVDKIVMPVSLSPTLSRCAGEGANESLREFFVNGCCVTVHEDLAALSLAVALRIAELAQQAIAARGVFCLALAGGETPRRCYEYLRELPVDWARVQLFFGDERCLPLGDANRNDTMAYDALIKHIDIPEANVHAISAESGAVVAAFEYAALLGRFARLDLVLLGLGEDGHTASLFPCNPATGSDASVVAVSGAPKMPPERVSLGMNTLNAARVKLFMAAGEGKRDPLARIAQGVLLPAAQVNDAEWHVDRAAWPVGG
ncbi:MAG: 6-phosphogluconolactonase [Gallionella sp.]|jgi:6-phosphogluconolactonase